MVPASGLDHFRPREAYLQISPASVSSQAVGKNWYPDRSSAAQPCQEVLQTGSQDRFVPSVGRAENESRGPRGIPASAQSGRRRLLLLRAGRRQALDTHPHGKELEGVDGLALQPALLRFARSQGNEVIGPALIDLPAGRVQHRRRTPHVSRAGRKRFRARHEKGERSLLESISNHIGAKGARPAETMPLPGMVGTTESEDK